MPLIDVICANDHIREVNRPLAMYPATPPCPECAAPTTQTHLPPQTTWTLPPTIVFRAPDGSVRFPGANDGASTGKYEKMGYDRIELRSAADVRRFEKHMDRREYSRACRKVERAQQFREQSESARRAELRRLMPQMSEFGRSLARAAVERNNNKPLERARDANFHLECLSYDRSNRGESRDEHGRRRRD